MKLVRLFSLFIIVVVLASPTQVLAQSPQSPLNDETDQVETFESVVEYDLNDPQMAANRVLDITGATGCKGYTLGIKGSNYAGVMLWKYSWTINWCYNGTTITSVQKYRTVWVNWSWNFRRDISDDSSGGVGQTSYSHYGQGEFCFINVGVCVAYSYPWVSQTVRGNGTYSGSAGGD